LPNNTVVEQSLYRVMRSAPGNAGVFLDGLNRPGGFPVALGRAARQDEICDRAIQPESAYPHPFAAIDRKETRNLSSLDHYLAAKELRLGYCRSMGVARYASHRRSL
jgi:hypothetical protein